MAEGEAVAALDTGSPDWAHYRAFDPDREIDLTDVDLRGRDLSGFDLSGVDLRRAALGDCTLDGTDFSRSNLDGADLRAVRGAETDLGGVALREADLTGARLANAHLSGADLAEANITDAKLEGADLSGADLLWVTGAGSSLRGANLVGASLMWADLRGVDLEGTDLTGASLGAADLTDAVLRETELAGADFTGTNLTRADLGGANLRQCALVETTITDTSFQGCRIYGLAAWDLKGQPKDQRDLIITPNGQSPVTVDDLEMAQFIYLLLHNEKIRQIVDTITSKAVLLLGRFTEERKAVLDALRVALRERGFSPILFDFDPSAERNLTETITLLARMARFIVVDLTDPSSVPHELVAIVPTLPSVPVQPILAASAAGPYAMFADLRSYPWVLAPFRYDDFTHLHRELDASVIAPAEAKRLELRKNADAWT